MATVLSIDNNLLEEARILGKHATKTAVVDEALAEYIQTSEADGNHHPVPLN